MKIVFCGSGNVTKSCLADMFASLRYLPLNEPLEIVVHNHHLNHAMGVLKDFMAGMSVDLRIKIHSTDNLKDLAGANLVIITAGTYPSEQELSEARQAGTDREIQSIVNYPIISEIAVNVRLYAPNAHVIMVTNQVDFCTQLMHEKTGFPQGRVIGFGGILDTSRYKRILAEQLAVQFSIEVSSIEATVVGHHNASMFPLSKILVNGNVIDEIIPDQEKRQTFLQSVLDETRNYGATVTELNKNKVGSYLGPGALLSQTILAFTGIAPSFTAPFAVILEGRYNEFQLRGALSIPVTISKLSARINDLQTISNQDLVKFREISRDFQEKYAATRMKCEERSSSHSPNSAPGSTFFR